MARLPRIFLLGICFWVFLNTSFAGTKLTAADVAAWRSDIEYLAQTAPKVHANLFHSVDAAAFNASVRTLVSDLPRLTREQVIARLCALIASIGDGHNGVAFWTPQGKFRSLPIRTYLFRDGLYVIAAPQQHAALVGGRVTKIGRVDIEKVSALLLPLISSDNQSGARAALPVVITTPEFLEALGIVKDASTVEFEIQKEGKPLTAALQPVDQGMEDRTGWRFPAGWAVATQSSPLWLENPKEWMRSTYLREQKAMYVQLNGIVRDKVSPGEFITQALQEAESQGAERFIIDLRHNDGGNNGLIRPVIHALIKSARFNQPGRLFVLISRHTFSAAQNLANHLELNTRAVFVGEPTGGRPNHYGDAVPVILPRSKLMVRLSAVYWQDVDPRDTRAWTAPQVPAALTFQNYVSGNDPALAAVAAYDPKTSLLQQLRDLAAQGDFQGFRERMKRFDTDPANAYLTAEAAANRVGYELFGQRKHEPMIKVFLLNTEMYPASSNVWDSLGDGYGAMNEPEKAQQAYEKALQLNPRNLSARMNLQRLIARRAEATP